MSTVSLVSPEEAQRLLQRGYTYVDVRSELEFTEGHPPGAVNVPLLHVEGDRLVDNPEFDAVMCAAFRTADPLVIGCHSGARSSAAVTRLRALGFTTVVEMQHGFNGARDAFGRRLPGWLQHGLPVEHGEPSERRYEAVRARQGDVARSAATKARCGRGPVG